MIIKFTSEYDIFNHIEYGAVVTIGFNEPHTLLDIINWCSDTFHYNTIRKIHGYHIFVFNREQDLIWFLTKWS